MAGAPEGNQNARRGREWRNALERALAKRGNGDRTKALDELAEKFLAAALEMTIPTVKRGPSIDGLRELADRLDGKSMQQLVHSGDEENPVVIKKIERVIVDGSSDTNS